MDEYAKIPLTTTGNVYDGKAKLVSVPKNAEELNWSKKKLVSSVKNQGLCGNGFAFGGVGVV